MRQFIFNGKTEKNGSIIVTGKDYRYLMNVLRLKINDKIDVRLKNGNLELMEIIRCDGKTALLKPVPRAEAKEAALVTQGVSAFSLAEQTSATQKEYWLFQFMPKPQKMDLDVIYEDNDIIIINKEKTKALFQQRSSNKDLYPNMWDISVGGHIMSRESDSEAVKRELKEELGINPDGYNIEFIKKYKEELIDNSIDSKEIVSLFLLLLDDDIENLKLQKEESIYNLYNKGITGKIQSLEIYKRKKSFFISVKGIG